LSKPDIHTRVRRIRLGVPAAFPFGRLCGRPGLIFFGAGLAGAMHRPMPESRFMMKNLAALVSLCRLPVCIAAAATALGIGLARAGEPALLSIGVGEFDEIFFDPRVGYFSITYNRPHYQFRPRIGVETTSHGSFYGSTGMMYDFKYNSFLFSPSLSAGLYERGGGKNLAYPLEFKTQFEFGYEFENKSRFTIALNHISNARLGFTIHQNSYANPGEDSVIAYYHIPVDWLFPH
jgi:hypothetical protein